MLRAAASVVTEAALCSTKSIIKVDMWADEGEGLNDADGRRREIMFGDGVIGGEATFVARDSHAMLRRECAEDDGFLVVYVTDTNGSNDAADMESFCMVRPRCACCAVLRGVAVDAPGARHAVPCSAKMLSWRT